MSKIELILKVNGKKVCHSEWNPDLTYGEELDAQWFHTAVSDVMKFKDYDKYKKWICTGSSQSRDKKLPPRYLLQTIGWEISGSLRLYFDVHDLFNFLIISGENNAASLIMEILKKDKAYMKHYENS